MKATLERFRQDIVTFGKLDFGIKNQKDIYTLELPWNDNKEDISCIPQGLYNFTPFISKTQIPKEIWKAVYVPNRTDILFHSGNYASYGIMNGKPFKPNVKGCILVGLGIEEDIPMVTKSRLAIEYMNKIIGKNGFSVEIINAFS